MTELLSKTSAMAFATIIICSAWGGTTVYATPDAATIFSAAEKFTVKIRSKIEYPHYENSRGIFQGAGFIVNRERGWIATNAHVIGKIHLKSNSASKVVTTCWPSRST